MGVFIGPPALVLPVAANSAGFCSKLSPLSSHPRTALSSKDPPDPVYGGTEPLGGRLRDLLKASQL